MAMTIMAANAIFLLLTYFAEDAAKVKNERFPSPAGVSARKKRQDGAQMLGLLIRTKNKETARPNNHQP